MSKISIRGAVPAPAIPALVVLAVQQQPDPGVFVARREALYLKELKARGPRWIK